VQSFAIKKTVACYKEIAQNYNPEERRIFFIGHQANFTMLQSVCRRCEIAEDRHLYNIDAFGNTGAAGAPTVLGQNWDTFEDGDVVALSVVGAGLSWASLAIEFKPLAG